MSVLGMVAASQVAHEYMGKSGTFACGGQAANNCRCRDEELHLLINTVVIAVARAGAGYSANSSGKICSMMLTPPSFSNNWLESSIAGQVHGEICGA
jgi:hypothetical protein